jgi:hypothetical protein
VALEPHEFDHPSRTDRGDGRCGGLTLHRSRLIRYPDAPRNRSEGQAPRDGVLALAFHTLLSFQGTSPGRSSATHLRFPCLVAAGAAGTVPRASQARQRLPTCPDSVLLVEHHPPRRHLHTEAPPCARTFWASGRPPNSRWIGSCWRSATPCLPMPTPLASSGEVLGLEDLPCLQPAEGSTGSDSVSTRFGRVDSSNHNGSSASEGATAGAGPVFPAGREPGQGARVRTRAPAAAAGTAARRSAAAPPARPPASSAPPRRPAGRRAAPPPG